MCQITRPAKIEHLEEFCDFVSNRVAAYGASMKVVHEIDLAIDEAATNVINYAYENTAGDLTVSISLEDSLEEPKTLVIALIDHGKPFNPLTIPPPDLESDIDHRPIGGLGLHLIRKFTDSVYYRREDDKNILTFRKELHDSPS
ncbi:MAG: ATP-binding protein [Deltaproteobacteria bacterium]|nr:ATP-binding protein [Deltaproteobacteria bacterium]